MSRRRQLLRIALGLGGGGAGLSLMTLIGGGFWLATPGGNDFLREVVEDQVSAQMPLGSLEVGALRSDLFTYVELSDVTMHRWDGDTMLTVPRIRLDHNLPRPSQQTVLLPRLEIDAPDLRMEQQPDGQIDLLIAFGVTDEPSAEPPSAWEGLEWLISLENAVLSDGRFTWVSGDDEQVIEGLSLDTGLSIGGGREARLHDLTIHAEPVGYADAALVGDLRYEDGNVFIDALDLTYDQSVVGVTGTIHQVELDMGLGLEVALKPLAAGQLSQWTNDVTPKTELTSVLSVRGPLSEIDIRGALVSDEAGSLDMVGMVDVTAEPITWSLSTSTERLELDRLLPPVTEPVELVGSYRVSGSGTAWPDGIVARIEVDAEEQILWGEPVSGLSLEADLAGGRVTVEALSVSHALGELGLTGGWVDITNEAASLQADLTLPDLGALARFDLSGYRGSLAVRGPVELDWSKETVQLTAFPSLRGSNIRSKDFTIGALRSEDLQVAKSGDDITFQGALNIENIDAAGLLIDTLALNEISGDWSSAAGVAFETDIAMGRMLVGDGTFELSGLGGPVSGTVPPTGEADITTELLLGELVLLPADYTIDGGPVGITFKDNGIAVDLSLSRRDRVVIEAKTYGDFTSGKWRVEELALFPTSGRGMVSVQETPIRFTLNEDNFDDVELVLVISEERQSASSDLSDVSYIAVSGGTGGNEPDLNLTVSKLPLSWLSDVLNTFLGEEGMPFVALMDGAVDGEASLKGLSGDAALSGDIHFTDFTFPEVIHDVDVSAQFDGVLRQPEVAVRLSDSDGLLIALEGSVPLDLDAATLDCAADIALRALLAPGELGRLEAVFPAVQGLYGLGSADVHLNGSACDPQMAVVGALSLPIGEQGEHMRLDLRMDRADEVVNITATADEGMLRRVKLSGTAQNRFSEVLSHVLSGEGEAPDYADPTTWVSSLELNLVPLAVPLESLTALFGLPSGLSGRIAGGVSLTGEVERPQLAGGLLWVEGQVGDVPLQIANLNLFPETDAESESEGYRLMGALDFGPQGNLSVDGFIPLTLAWLKEEDQLPEGEDELSITVSGDGIPLAVLNGVVDGVSEATGTLTIQGDIIGPVTEPVPRLKFQIVDGGLAYRPLGVRYSDINTDVRLQQDRLVVDRLRVLNQPLLNNTLTLKDTVGVLSGTGSVMSKGMDPGAVVVELSADNFWLTATTDYTAAIRGELTVGGNYPALQVVGDVVLSEGRFNFDDSFFMDNENLALDPMITVYRKEKALQTVVEVQAPSALEEQMTVALGVDLNRNLRMAVDMPLLDTYGRQISSLSTVSILADMDGILDVGWQDGALSLNGTVETLTGSTTRLFDTSFAMASGSAVYFVGDDYANPILKLNAVHSNSRYGEVNVDISGSADKPEVAFSADQYDETDILFLLLFGKPASEMSEGESSAGSLLFSTAMASISGQVSRAVGGTLIDEFDWDPDSGMRIGKALSEQLFLAYDRNSNPEDDENINQLTLEWIISRRMYAQFMTGDMAQSSADIYWRWLF